MRYVLLSTKFILLWQLSMSPNISFPETLKVANYPVTYGQIERGNIFKAGKLLLISLSANFHKSTKTKKNAGTNL